MHTTFDAQALCFQPRAQLNPQAPSFRPTSILNPGAPSFAPSTEAVSHLPASSLNREAPVFEHQRKLNPEAPLFQPFCEARPETLEGPVSLEDISPCDFAEVRVNFPNSLADGYRQGEIEDDEAQKSHQCIEEPVSDLIVATCELPPEFHHLNWLGDPVDDKTFTKPATSLAIIMSAGKLLGWTICDIYEKDLRKQISLHEAFHYIDPVVFTGDRQILRTLSGTALENAAIGQTEKFYSDIGWWTEDWLDNDEDTPRWDSQDQSTYEANDVVFNGYVDDGDVRLIQEHWQEANEEVGRRPSGRAYYNEKMARKLGKSPLSKVWNASDVDEYDVPLASWADSVDNNDDWAAETLEEELQRIRKDLKIDGKQGDEASVPKQPVEEDDSPSSIVDSYDIPLKRWTHDADDEDWPSRNVEEELQRMREALKIGTKSQDELCLPRQAAEEDTCPSSSDDEIAHSEMAVSTPPSSVTSDSDDFLEVREVKRGFLCAEKQTKNQDVANLPDDVSLSSFMRGEHLEVAGLYDLDGQLNIVKSAGCDALLEAHKPLRLIENDGEHDTHINPVHSSGEVCLDPAENHVEEDHVARDTPAIEKNMVAKVEGYVFADPHIDSHTPAMGFGRAVKLQVSDSVKKNGNAYDSDSAPSGAVIGKSTVFIGITPTNASAIIARIRECVQKQCLRTDVGKSTAVTGITPSNAPGIIERIRDCGRRREDDQGVVRTAWKRIKGLLGTQDIA